jgi:hypothetical protein
MFSAIHFQWPTTLADAVATLNNALGGAAGELGAAQSRLAAVPDYTQANNPVAASAVGSIAEHGQIIDAMLARVNVVCVHPWVQGVGQGNGHSRYLSTANAVLAAGGKLKDSFDSQIPAGVVDAITIIMPANGFFDFHEKLKQFNAVLPTPETILCERRAAQVASVEKDKILLPSPAINSRWRDNESAHSDGIKCATQSVGELSAFAEAYEMGAHSAEQELTDLMSKKNNVLNGVRESLTHVQARFANGVGLAKYIGNKTPAQISEVLSASGTAHDAPLCCCVVVTGAPREINLLREMLGL